MSPEPVNPVDPTSIENSKRRVNPGAEKWMGVSIPVLDHGSVMLVGYDGDDQKIEEAARISYGKGTRPVEETRGLIRTLRRDRHTSPFEMPSLTFQIEMPLTIATQHLRHRTASVNMYSGRYSIMEDKYYTPEPGDVNEQSKANRQGRGSAVDPVYAQEVLDKMSTHAEGAYDLYQYLLNVGEDGKPVDPNRPQVAKELARMVLPPNYYTSMEWKMNVHNLLHYLKLRLASDAQLEIRQYAEAFAKVTADAFPLTWEAFIDYELEAVNLSKPEWQILASLFKAQGVMLDTDTVKQLCIDMGLTSVRERTDFFNKLRNWGILPEKE